MFKNARPNPGPWQDPVFPFSCPYFPAREIPRNGGAFTGKVSSSKNGRLVAWEGLAERGLYRLLEGVPNVWRYLEQPCRIPFVSEDGTESGYTPDVLILFHPPSDPAWRVPPLLLEVKPLEILRTWWQEHQAKLTSAMAFAWKVGWDFRVITDVEIDSGRAALIEGLNTRSIQRATSPARLPLLDLIDLWGELPWEGVCGRMPSYSQRDISIAAAELMNEGVLDLRARRPPYLIRRLRSPHQSTNPVLNVRLQ